ncbi:zeta toxin-domain-containing protein [Aspergillus pseudocaelatus]|uniref:Zeta toxin-domain-containing protein n=1 Tax=Aspergillus pseudocaelatus TaxID=1825620 RepID=A0ABQ6WTR3_9EURO|nr:zeta toxin-domain-containing protein [Aspergillus pseudocaelatus]
MLLETTHMQSLPAPAIKNRESTTTVSDQLDPDTHAEIFHTIQTAALATTNPVDQPMAILLGGQPGAGKSRLASAAMKDLGGNAVKVDADELRQFHPRYIDLMRENDLTASDRIHPDAGPWAVKLTRAAITARRNLVIDGTMRNADDLVALCRSFREAGYYIEARVMAVSRLVSRLSIHERYEHQRQAIGFGRWVSCNHHDAAFAGVPLTVERLEAYRLVDRMAIYVRDNDAPVYENRLEHGIWQRPPAGRTRLDAERIQLEENSAGVMRLTGAYAGKRD